MKHEWVDELPGTKCDKNGGNSLQLKELKISAFGPFGDEIALSFTELGKDGLFLLHGNTGSGKTTIFDAVCFALFGNASGENRGADSFRSDYAKPERKTFVELSFSHKGEEYRVYRAPAYERKKKRGDGVTLSKAESAFYKAGQIVTSGYVPVTNEITELLGVDWKQFKQIAMLAQGEFLKLLYADSVERAGILRRIFGTEHYEALQRKLKTYMLEKKARCEELEQSLRQLLGGIQIEENESCSILIQEWNKEKSVHRIPELLELIRQLIQMQKQFYEEKSRQKEECQKKWKELTVKEAFWMTVEKKRATCEQYKKEIAKIKQEEETLLCLEQTIQEQLIRLCEEEIKKTEQLSLYEHAEEEQRNIEEAERKQKEKWNRLKNWEKQAEELEKLYQEKTDKQKQFVLLYQVYETAREEAIQTERMFLAEQAGILAEQLQEGMPCPVCGSTIHPCKAELSTDTVSEELVKQKKAAMERAEQVSTKVNTECYGLKRECAVRTETYLEEVKEAGVQHGLTALETDEQRGLLRTYLAKYREEQKKERDILQKRRQENEENIEKKQRLLQQLEAGKIQKEQQQKKQNQVEKQLSAKQEQLVIVERFLQEAEKELEEQHSEERQEEEWLQAGKTLLEQERKQIEVQLQQLFSRMSVNERIEQDTVHFYTMYETVKKEYVTADVLSKTANGELVGKARIPFEQYAQAFYFEQILQAANQKFFGMTNGQYELRRKKEASNLRSISGLELEVMDYYTGKIRGIRSLSGGESFQAALSLALGLSDVIEAFAGGIELGVLFLDEGFGTLDAQALDMAVTTLRQLAGGQRMVGIISHVEELKERIEKKVMVVKDRTGSTIIVGTK